MKFRLRTLGTPALLRDDGTPVGLALGKPFAVLVHVALETGPITRDDLADVFWPEAPRERARQSVRQALWLLRRTLGSDAFSTDEPVLLNPGILSADVTDLRDALATGDIAGAILLWGGAFMERFAIPNARRWSVWADEQADALSTLFANALCNAALSNRAEGRLGTALERLRRAVAVAPFSATAHGLLVDMLLDARELDAASAALGDARRQFGEGGAGIDLTALQSRLDSLRVALLPGPARGGLHTEFVGRSAELADLLGLWRSARAGRTRVALVAGPTGIGKTRLAAEIAAVAKGDGCSALAVKAAEPERDIEFGVTGALVRQLLRMRGAAGVSGASDAVLRSLVPSLSNGGAGNGPNGTDHEYGSGMQQLNAAALADALADLLGAVADETPLLIVLDDLQWADAASRGVLASVLRGVRDSACLFIATFRVEDAGPELIGLVRALEREHIGTPFQLGPLSPVDVSELLGLMAEFSDPSDIDRIAHRLQDVTGGNPLFLGELIRAFQDEGIIEPHADGLVIHADRLPDRFRLPASVRAVVDRRLDRLTPDAAVLAGHLARQPRGVRLGALRQRTCMEEGPFTHATGELLEREVVRWADDQTLEFTHDQLRDGSVRRFPVSMQGPGSGGGATDRRPRRRRLALLAAAAAMILVPATLFAWWRSSVTVASPLYGGGSLYFMTEEGVFTAEPPINDGGPWTVRSVPGLAPTLYRGRLTHGPFLDSNHERIWLERQAEQGKPSSGIGVYDDGRPAFLARDSGDVVVGTLSPDGRFMTFLRDDPSTERYDWQLMVEGVDGSAAHQVAGPAPSVAFGGWAPDGSRFSSRARGEEVDSIFLFTPDGVRAGAIALPGHTLTTPSWCAPRRIVTQVWFEGEPRLAVVDPATGSVHLVDGPGPEHGDLACSPDGSAVAYATVVSGRVGHILQSLDGGSSQLLEIPEGASLLNWLPAEPPAFPRSVKVAGRDSVVWGDTVRLEAIVSANGSRPWTGSVIWRSLQPLVLSVDSSGVAVANRPGLARIVAATPSMLADTLEIEVLRGEHLDDLLVDEPFETLELDRWIVVGDAATPWPTLNDGLPALRLTGDGQYLDGLYLREPFDLPRGGTLEADFRFKLTRWDHQSFNLCLADTELRPGQTGADHWDWAAAEQLCFRYPAFLETSSDASHAQGSAGNTVRLIDVTPDLPADQWTHVAVQVQPDGQVDFFLNGRHVLTLPVRVRNVTHRHWRIALSGKSVDTEVFVRGLTLWHGARY